MKYDLSGSFEDIGLRTFRVETERVITEVDYVVAPDEDSIVDNYYRYKIDPRVTKRGEPDSFDIKEISEEEYGDIYDFTFKK